MTDDRWDERSARIALSAQCEPGDPRVGGAVRRWGAPHVLGALQGGSGRDVGCEHLGERWRPDETARLIAEETARARAGGARFIRPDTAGWPTQLNDLGDRAPLMLRCTGTEDLRIAASRSVAVVGARACTRYGASVAETLAADLAHAGWCVISGVAFGIDASSHLGALAAGGISVGVTAGGADMAVPRGNEQIYDRLRATGCVVSEVPLGWTPSRQHFLVRNRVIAALARAVVIVEAGRRSGAARTGAEAASLGRVVGAVPGPVTSDMSIGCNSLLRDTFAVLIRDAQDVIGMLSPLAPPTAFSPQASAVLDELARARSNRSASAAELASACDIDEDTVRCLLVRLGEGGAVRRVPGGWVLVRPRS